MFLLYSVPSHDKDWIVPAGHWRQRIHGSGIGSKHKLPVCDRARLSNGLVVLSGAFVAQSQGFADVSMGTGLIITGIAALILGEGY